MTTKHKRILLIHFIFVLVAFLMLGISFATPYFIEINYSMVETHYAGLWKYCKTLSGSTTCINTNMEIDSPYIKVCQAMCIIALEYGIVCVVSTGLKSFCFPEKGILQVTAIVTICAVIFYSLVPIGLFIFYDSEGVGRWSKLSYSFFLCVTGDIFAVISSIAMIIDLLSCKKVRVGIVIKKEMDIPLSEV